MITCSSLKTNDYCSIPQQLKDQLSERYPGARRAYLKTGGDFPFLSRSDEVNLHLQVMLISTSVASIHVVLKDWWHKCVFPLLIFTMCQLHLRRVGVEARPDLVKGISKDGSGGSSSEKNDEREDSDVPPKDNGGSPESPSTETQLPEAPESSGSHSLDDQLLSNAKVCFTSPEHVRLLISHAFFEKQQDIVSTRFVQPAWEIFILCLLPLYVETMYITWIFCWKSRCLV